MRISAKTKIILNDAKVHKICFLSIHCIATVNSYSPFYAL